VDQLVQTLRLNLINSQSRPTYSFSRNGVEILAMYDSGAIVPVWCLSEKSLLKSYPEAILVNETGYISGFGKGKEECKIYKIPVFELSDENATYRINNLHIAVCKQPQIGCTLIMSETMFSKTDTLIKRINEKSLIFYYDKTEYNCTFKYYSADKFSIAIWAQNE